MCASWGGPNTLEVRGLGSVEGIKLLDLGVSHVKGDLRGGDYCERERCSRPAEGRTEREDRAASS